MNLKTINAKKIFFLATMLCIYAAGFAQVQNPVNWAFTAKKKTVGVYEIYLTATIGKGWHTYSQTTPGGGPVPTSITFTKNPLIVLDGKTKEVGTLEQHHEPLFGVNVKQFSNKVDFVQLIKVKGNVKTTVAGSVEFMVCNDKECLPPKTEVFSISLK